MIKDAQAMAALLQRWPQVASGSLSGSWTGFAALLAYRGYYRALAEDATILADGLTAPGG
jgi:hypothetical protein